MNSFLFVTDLDNTLIGDDSALIELNHLLRLQQPEIKIVYATGRSLTLYQQLAQTKPFCILMHSLPLSAQKSILT